MHLHRDWLGPYLVVDIKSNINYEIQETPRSKCKIVHVDQLKKFEGEPPHEAWKSKEANQLGSLAEDEVELPEVATSATDMLMCLTNANEEVIVEDIPVEIHVFHISSIVLSPPQRWRKNHQRVIVMRHFLEEVKGKESLE